MNLTQFVIVWFISGFGSLYFLSIGRVRLSLLDVLLCLFLGPVGYVVSFIDLVSPEGIMERLDQIIAWKR